MHIYLVKYNNNIIGSYSEYSVAENFILSCYQNKFMTSNASIVYCVANSCYFIDNYVIPMIATNPIPEGKSEGKSKEKSEEKQEQELKKDNIDIFITPEYINNNNQKIKLQHEINLLKQKKEKLEQSKKVWETDLKLYSMFKESKMKDESFVIPELFVNKYNIFEELSNNNTLSLENFANKYKHENVYNDYFNVSYHDNLCSNPIDYISSDEDKHDIVKEIENELDTSEFNASSPTPTYSNDELTLFKTF